MDTPRRPPSGAPSRGRHVRVLGVAAVALLLAGCRLRLETPEPDPLVPDDREVLRADSAADAVDLRDRATEAAVGAPPEIAAVLERVAEASDAHHDAFGGTYVPFPDVTPPTPTPTPTATTAPPPPATPEDVLAGLVEGAAEARSDAEAVPDGRMARLLASVSVARSLLAEALTTALGTGAGPTVVFVVPEAVPDGVTTQEVAVLVQSEDATALAWEVTAARSIDAERALAAARATTHRDRAQQWAEAAGIAGSGTDPRRSSYTLPEVFGDLVAPPESRLEALGEVEAALAISYMSLVANAGAGARGVLIDAVLDTLRVQTSQGVPVPDFPALPD